MVPNHHRLLRLLVVSLVWLVFQPQVSLQQLESLLALLELLSSSFESGAPVRRKLCERLNCLFVCLERL